MDNTLISQPEPYGRALVERLKVGSALESAFPVVLIGSGSYQLFASCILQSWQSMRVWMNMPQREDWGMVFIW